MNLIELLRSKGVVVRENHSHENEIWICCPFCVSRSESADTKFRLGVNLATDKARCFNCDWKSREAAKWIARKLGEFGFVSDGVRAKDSEDVERVVSLPEGFQLLSKVGRYDAAFGVAKKYVNSRGVAEWQLRKWNVGATLLGRFAYRVVFPVIEKRTLVGLVGRDWTGSQQPKYLNSAGMKTIFGDTTEKKIVVLVEGILKALAIERAFFENEQFSGWGVAALLGHSVTDKQLDKLKKSEELVVFGDPDWPGRVGGLRVAALASSGWHVSLISPWPEKQADEMQKKSIQEALVTRKPWSRAVAMEARWQALKG